MPNDSLAILLILFLMVGALYASVGHAGASGYMAVMALLGTDVAIMRPTALSINILVATIAFIQFARAGHFSWSLAWPFAIAAVPCAFIGGRIQLSAGPLKIAIGVLLLLSAARMAWAGLSSNARPQPPSAPPRPAALICGAIIGLIAGLTGTGGGIVLSPLMLVFNWASIRHTAAAASFFILLNSIAGLGGLATSGWTPPASLGLLAGAACLGGLLGSQFGSRVARPRTLNVLLAVVLCIAGAKLIVQ